MKAFFTILIFVIFLSTHSFGQTKVGVRGGFNFSGLTTESNFGFQVTIGWHVGLMGKKYLGDLGYFIQAEALYQNQGNTNHDLNYIKIPLFVGFDFSDDFNFHLGLYYGNRVGKNDEFKKVDFGGTLGIDFYLKDKVIMTLQFQHGFKNIVADDANLSFSTANNAVLDLSIIYLFNRD